MPSYALTGASRSIGVRSKFYHYQLFHFDVYAFIGKLEFVRQLVRAQYIAMTYCQSL